MRYISYCFSTLLLLFFLSSCGSESTPVYSLTTTPTPDEAGSVSPSSGEYDEGETVEITATPNADWRFVRWAGDIAGDENPKTVIVDRDLSINAIFDDSPFEGGDGSEKYPYKVSTIDQLQAIGESRYLDSYFIQINDIDASETENWNNGKGFEPIGNFDERFDGTYDGAGFKILKLSILRPEEQYIGLFGLIEEGELININITEATVSSSWLVGIIAGFNRFGKIHKSYATGRVNGPVAGGIAGENHGEIYESGANAEVSNKEGQFTVAGGLVGINCEDGLISNSYSNGNVKGNSDVGGLVGYNCAEITYSFSTGEILVDEEENVETIGGFVGFIDGLVGAEIISGYWDKDSSGKEIGVGLGPSDGASGLTTTEMHGSSAEENMPELDWDEIWMTVSGDYPILRWQEN